MCSLTFMEILLISVSATLPLKRRTVFSFHIPSSNIGNFCSQNILDKDFEWNFNKDITYSLIGNRRNTSRYIGKWFNSYCRNSRTSNQLALIFEQLFSLIKEEKKNECIFFPRTQAPGDFSALTKSYWITVAHKPTQPLANANDDDDSIILTWVIQTVGSR